MRTRGGAVIKSPPSPATISLLSAFEQAAATRPTSPVELLANSWICNQCTFVDNQLEDKRCKMCSGRRQAHQVVISKRKRKRNASSSSSSSSSAASSLSKNTCSNSSTVLPIVSKKSPKKKKKKYGRGKNVKVLASPSFSPKRKRVVSFDYEDETEAQLAREELSKKLLGISSLPRTAPMSALKLNVQLQESGNVEDDSKNDDFDGNEDGDGEYALVGLKISIKGSNNRWKKCNVIRVHGEIQGKAIVQWVSSGKETVVRLFGKGAMRWKL